MKKISIILSVLTLSVILTSCSVTVPLSVSAAPIGAKQGVSKTGVLFGFIMTNKSFGVAEAAHNGKIKAGVATVDMKTSWAPIVRVFYYKKEIIVQGN